MDGTFGENRARSACKRHGGALLCPGVLGGTEEQTHIRASNLPDRQFPAPGNTFPSIAMDSERLRGLVAKDYQIGPSSKG